MENADFYVDAITSDGAQTNRGVWNLLGISENSEFCQHPCDPQRKLFMFSDFCHLVKNIRNGIIQHQWFQVNVLHVHDQ